MFESSILRIETKAICNLLMGGLSQRIIYSFENKRIMNYWIKLLIHA